ncbi:flagellar biosynthetic protein FliO [Pseudalkalibacillus decolorationis]|uniref:flagellar biosynthetic protein FliO n=1 Tax=Pseudalkalibacillus decolorationis TaxID=163879 RepID=UPI00214876CC|nr:flagellar biosynthetic protein FliO [Pseudalkalibacillus decolorationis]
MLVVIFKQILLILLFLFVGLGGLAENGYATTHQTAGCEMVNECIKQNKDDTQVPLKSKTKDTPPSKSKGDTSTFSTTIKVLFALVFVVGLLILVLKLLHKRTQVVQQGKGIQTLGGAMLGHQRSVQMVKVGKTVLVLGVGENVSLIKEINNEEDLKGLLSQFETSSSSKPFKSGLLNWVNNRFKVKSVNTSSFQETFKKRLDEASKGRMAIYEETMKKEQRDDRTTRDW